MSSAPAQASVVPSIILGLGEALEQRLRWLERRIRTEIRPAYPDSLLRFGLITRPEQVCDDWIRDLCEPLLAHPLWLDLYEQGLVEVEADGIARPEFGIYVIVNQHNSEAQALLEPLCQKIHDLYGARVRLRLNLFYIASQAEGVATVPAPATSIPLLCFLLGPIKYKGFWSSGEHEPYEVARIALNTLLTSKASEQAELFVKQAGSSMPALVSLGASAIVVDIERMETCLYGTVLQRLISACFHGQEDEEQCAAWERELQDHIAEFFGAALQGWDAEDYERLWKTEVAAHASALLLTWANETLEDWDVEVTTDQRGMWSTRIQGQLLHHLQKILQGGDKAAKEDLASDICRIAADLQVQRERREKLLLGTWAQCLQQTMSSGQGCMVRLAHFVSLTESVLLETIGTMRVQQASPLHLRSRGERQTLADFLALRAIPICTTYERHRASQVSAGLVILLLIPAVLLAMASAVDLGFGWIGIGGCLALASVLALLFLWQQHRRLAKQYQQGLDSLLHLYAHSITGIVLGEAKQLLTHIWNEIALVGQRLLEMTGQLHQTGLKVAEAIEEAQRPAHEEIYLEQRLFRDEPWQRIAEQVCIEELMSAPKINEDEADHVNVVGETPTSIFEDVLNGEVPAAMLETALVDSLRRTYGLELSLTASLSIEEMLVTKWGEQTEREFMQTGNRRTEKQLADHFAQKTMDGLRQRALPLWDIPSAKGEKALVASTPNAQVAIDSWLRTVGGKVVALPTRHPGRISYLHYLLLSR